MYSGSTHLRMAHEPESGKPYQHRSKADEAKLAIGERNELREAITPQAWCDKGKEPLDDQHQREGRPQRIRHGVPLGFVRGWRRELFRRLRQPGAALVPEVAKEFRA